MPWRCGVEIILRDQEIKELLEEIFLRIIEKRPDLLKEILSEVLEDVAMANAIEEGRKTEFVDETEIMEILNGG